MTEWKSHSTSNFGESWDFEKNKVLQGIYVDHRSNVGKNHQEAYEIEVKGTKVTAWGSKMLNDGMTDVKIGEEVRIEFKGMGSSPNAIKDFKIFDVKSRTVEKTDLIEETKEDEMPF